MRRTCDEAETIVMMRRRGTLRSHAALLLMCCVLIMHNLHVLQACRSLSLSLRLPLPLPSAPKFEATRSLHRPVAAASGISTGYGHSTSLGDTKKNEDSNSTVASLLSLLAGDHAAATVERSLARQIFSCLRFLVPPLELPAGFHMNASPIGDQARKGALSKHAIDRLIQRPPPAVADLARRAIEWNGDAAVVLNSLSNESFLVPDVEGASEHHCELTKYSRGHRFKKKELNRYIAFLFESIAALAPSVGFNIILNRFDLFHGHMFLAKSSGRLGILFHAREYPAFDNQTFPVHLGFCQVGSPLAYDESMNLRNILWLAPLPNCAEDQSASKWLATGTLLILDAHPEGIIFKDLVPEYVDIVRTIYEDEFGVVVVDVNYFNSLNSRPEDRIFIC